MKPADVVNLLTFNGNLLPNSSSLDNMGINATKIQMKTTTNEHLRRQIGFLEGSCFLYDQGRIDEGIRIAIVLRVLMDKLLKNIEKEGHLIELRCSTCYSPAQPLIPDNIGQLSDLYFRTDKGTTYPFFVPRFVGDREPDKHRQLPWMEWWREPVHLLARDPDVIRDLTDYPIEYKKILKSEPRQRGDNRANTFTREDIARTACDKEGAHADESVPDFYGHFKAGMLRFVPIPNTNGETAKLEGSAENLHLSDLRQMAWEILNSESLMRLLSSRPPNSLDASGAGGGPPG